jgi:hypothetical protein
MRCTETERILVIKQLRRAREELIRAKLMMEAIADDERDAETVSDLEEMVVDLSSHLDGIVKADSSDPDEDASAGALN